MVDRTITGEQVILDSSDPDWEGSGFWDDLRSPFEAVRLDSAATRYWYDHTNCYLIFNNNARYPEEVVCMNFQLQHSWKEGSPLRPHLHWLQTSAAVPNWLIYRRWFANGSTPGAWTFDIYQSHAYTYVAGTKNQITLFSEIDASGYDVSDILQIKFYRDVANTSGQFGGAEAAPASAYTVEFDVHYLKENLGSPNEYYKF